MQVFKITINCDKEKFKKEELKEILNDFSIMKVKTEGIKIGYIIVEEIKEEAGNQDQSIPVQNKEKG